MIKLLLATLFVIAVISLLALVVTYTRRNPNTNLGFQDIVKNPALLDDMIPTAQEASNESKRLQALDMPTIEREIQSYIFSGEPESKVASAGRSLEKLAPRSHPILVRILEDQANAGRLRQTIGEGWQATSSIERLCQLFAGTMPDEAIRLLEPFLQDESEQIRKKCILAVAETGSGQR